MTENLTFCPPPNSKGGRLGSEKLRPLAAALRARPGEWAKIPGDYVGSVASSIKAGEYAALPAGEFDATARAISGTNRYHLWMRYIGGEA